MHGGWWQLVAGWRQGMTVVGQQLLLGAGVETGSAGVWQLMDACVRRPLTLTVTPACPA